MIREQRKGAPEVRMTRRLRMLRRLLLPFQPLPADPAAQVKRRRVGIVMLLLEPRCQPHGRLQNSLVVDRKDRLAKGRIVDRRREREEARVVVDAAIDEDAPVRVAFALAETVDSSGGDFDRSDLGRVVLGENGEF